jgi:low affinity Fe/Cu permease
MPPFEVIVDVALMTLISIVMVQNMGLREKLKDIEAKLDQRFGT